MKRILLSILLLLAVFVLVTPAHAFLINRGMDTLGNRLIYDDDLDITWYDFSNAATSWQNQVAWASGLSVVFGSTTYDDWRLPMTVNGPYVWSYDGTTSYGYNNTSSEMGHLFYTELGNLGRYGTNGIQQPGWGLSNKGDFQHLMPVDYWSGTLSSAGANVSWHFDFGPISSGRQDIGAWSNSWSALAVRSGDVATATSVPEPTTVALLGIGLAGMAVYGVRRRRQHR